MSRPLLVPLGTFTLAVLALEVFLVRLLAYTLDTFLVYLVLGIAMTGFGAAGSAVALRPAWLEAERVPRLLALFASAFSATLVLAYAGFVRLAPALPFGIGWITFAVASLLTLPFFAAGVVVTIALSTAGPALGRVYAADLVGSALGCFVPLLALGWLDGGRFIALVALIGWAAAWLFARRVVRPDRVLNVALVGSLGLAVLGFLVPGRVFPIEADPRGQLAAIERYAEQCGFTAHRLFDRWNMTGRIEVFEYRGVAGAPDPYPFRFYAQDNNAGAIMARWDGRGRDQVPPGRIDSSEVASMCSDTLFGQAYFTPRAKVLVIGVGGAADVECALYQGAAAVDAVEINPATVAAIRGPFDRFLGGIGGNPRVRYHVLDGRSFARAAAGRAYDLVQLSGVDTKSILASGALALSENHLYTREAFVDYFRSLGPGGALSLIRFGEPEALRLVSTAIWALRTLGEADPAAHVLVARNGPAYGVIVGRRALGPERLQDFHDRLWFADRPFRGMSVVFLEPFGYRSHERPEKLFAPGEPRDPTFARYFAALAAGQERAFFAGYPFDVRPVTDDRPFFFDTTRYDLPAARTAPHVVVLGMMVGSVLVLAVLVILVPLLRVRSGLRGLTLAATPVYFAGVGLGYLFVEIWLLHRFAMFLGHQAYALSVVLATLLAATGLGSLLGPRLGLAPARRTLLGVLGVAGWLLLGRAFLPGLLDALWTSSFPARVAVAGGFVLPAGLLMGLPLPAGLDWLRSEKLEAQPWAVGINFFASVVASVAAIPLALFSGYASVFAAGLACYAVALVAVPLMRRSTARPALAK